MNPITRLPLALAVLGLMAACAAADDSSNASATTSFPLSTPSSAPTLPQSVAPDSSDEPDASGAAEDGTVEIVGFDFAPRELTISAGSEVTFTNLDDFSHTATAGTADEPMPTFFDSGRLPKGDSFTFVFADPGTVAYYCVVHPSMEGLITVEE